MFKKYSEFLNILKTNKKLLYVVTFFILLVILSLVLKFDTSKTINTSSIKTNQEVDTNNIYDDYALKLENKLESIIKEIDGVNNVKAMVYTKRSTLIEPIYDESISIETSVDNNTDGVNQQTNRSNTQKQVKTDDNNQVLEKYFEYPQITGVLIVVNYTGNKNIYNVLTNSIKVLLDVEVNNIEIIVSNK